MKKCIVLLLTVITLILSGCKEYQLRAEDILNNEKQVVNEVGSSVYLREYSSPYLYEKVDIHPEKYALLDLDGDKSMEMVLHVPNIGIYIIFHSDGREIYAFEFVERGLIDLKKDGSFIQSSGAGINWWVTLKFKGNEYEIIEKAYKNDMDNEYRLNGEKATSEKVNNYKQEFERKDSVSWIETSD